ncbi:MAG: hypothetical protein ACYTGT_11015 [Planctomycetota bacterium]
MMKRLLVMVLAGMAATAQADVIEDFEDGDVSDYVLTGPIGLFETSPAAAHDGDLGLANNNSSGWAYRDDAGVQLVQGDTVSFWLNLGPKPGGRAYFGFGATAAGTMSLVAAPNTGDIRFQANPGYGFIELNSSPQVWEANKWYRLEVIWGVGGLLEGNLYDSDGETLLNTVSDVDDTFQSGGIAFRAFGGSDTFYDTVELPTADSDGDGIPDDEDACPDSILTPTIVINGCDSGVTNVLFEDGCTMSDRAHRQAASRKDRKLRGHGRPAQRAARFLGFRVVKPQHNGRPHRGLTKVG